MINRQETLEICAYIANLCQGKGYELTETKLYKLLWFASLRYAEKNLNVLLSDPFVHKSYGPVPAGLRDLITDLTACSSSESPFKVNVIPWENGNGCHKYIVAKRNADLDSIPPAKQAVLSEIINELGSYSAKHLTDLSHQDGKAWSKTSEGQIINISHDLELSEDEKEIVAEEYSHIISLSFGRYASA